jgi:non-specific serine/threonine protein kinase/serine/threonine-protein kinase
MDLTSNRWPEVRRIYERAIDLSESERTAFVDDQCKGNAELRAEVESLLQAREQAGDFLDRPVVDFKLAADSEQIATARVGQLIGPYRLEAQIGQGGMGEVYRAVRIDGEFERQVAIKLVRGGLDSGTVLNRFRQEKQILAALLHPHIAQLLDAGATDDGLPYLVIEYVDGTPIDEYCEANNIELRSRLTVFLDVCDTVQFAHQRLVVHRDLKPANILVSAGGAVKLLDFGIAKVLDGSARAEWTGTMMMTPAYASPEQIRGEAITTVSDVFSLGVLLYKLLAGTSPYNKDTTNAHALAIEICDHEPPSFSAAQAAAGQKSPRLIPRDLELITRKALRKLPSERYASVDEFARDIRNFLGGLPVTAAKGSTLYRMRKFVGRNRVGVAAAFSALALGTYGIWEIVQQRQIAERRFDDVRELANTIVFDVHDSIADLPGSTPARKVIVQRALEYLSRLEEEGAANLELQRDMAAAYEKIANVQGAPNSPNVGELDGAYRSYQKALELREAVAAREPNSIGDQLALAKIRRIYANFLVMARNDLSGGESQARAALAIGTQLAARYPSDTQIRMELFDDQQVLGDILSDRYAAAPDKLREAAALFEHAGNNLQLLIESSPDDNLLKHKSVVIAWSFADLSRKAGDRQKAVAILERARATLLALEKRSASPKIRSNLAVVDATIGEIQLVDDKPRAAAEAFQRAAEIRRILLAADPANVNLRSGEIANRASLAIATALQGEWIESASAFVNAADEFRSLAEKTGSNDYRQRAALCDVWSGVALEKIGEYAAAKKHYRSALAAYDAALAATPDDSDSIIAKSMTLTRLGQLAISQKDVATAKTQSAAAIRLLEDLTASNASVADIDVALAEAHAGAGDARVSAREFVSARQSYERSATSWRKLTNPGRLNSGGFPLGSLSEVERKLRALDTQN